MVERRAFLNGPTGGNDMKRRRSCCVKFRSECGSTQARTLLLVALTLVLSTAFARYAPAASCINFLAVGEATVRPAPDGAVMDMVGIWEFDNIMQVELGLSLNALVYQGDHFVRYPLIGDAESGTFSGLGDGLDASELPALEASGAGDPDAEVLTFRAHRLQLSLPPSFSPGAVSVLMYLVQDGEYQSAFLSNTVSTQF